MWLPTSLQVLPEQLSGAASHLVWTVPGGERVVGLEADLGVLPVAEAVAAGLVLDVEDRDVAALHHEVAVVVDVADLETGAVGAGALGGPDDGHLPDGVAFRPGDVVGGLGARRGSVGHEQGPEEKEW